MAFGTNYANSVLASYDGYYVSLHDGNPGSTGANEIVGGSYARKQVSFGAAANKQALNDTILDFTGMPDTTSSPITHVGLWTQASDGNFVIGGELTSPKVTNAGDTFRFPVGDLAAILT